MRLALIQRFMLISSKSLFDKTSHEMFAELPQLAFGVFFGEVFGGGMENCENLNLGG